MRPDPEKYDEIFEALEIDADPFALCQLNGAADLGLGRKPQATLHYFLSGQGEVTVFRKGKFTVGPGSLLLIPSCQSHDLRSFGALSDPIPKCNTSGLQLAQLIAGEEDPEGAGGDQMMVLCARLSIGLRGAHQAINLIREPMLATTAARPRLVTPLKAMMEELAAPTIGSRAVLRAILHQCVIELLRSVVLEDKDELNWMVNLRDPALWMATKAMLDDPAAPHSMESLAHTSGMSRSTFAKRFADAYGAGPMSLLRSLRINRAETLLIEQKLPIKSVAQAVGFSSRSAFARSFEVQTGLSPSAFRSGKLEDGGRAVTG